ncbi:hypothetical protein EVAR_49905_1 [Eumeta japonica]|uniref:Uncharacterized protein n=1 Tax=Eumeta variegata TaxID=151549 RepID=A0A4C1Y2N6_EUMVA|nr:hypothetical protein EVAR_49905_1 [Eumeta japonica]
MHSSCSSEGTRNDSHFMGQTAREASQRAGSRPLRPEPDSRRTGRKRRRSPKLHERGHGGSRAPSVQGRHATSCRCGGVATTGTGRPPSPRPPPARAARPRRRPGGFLCLASPRRVKQISNPST